MTAISAKGKVVPAYSTLNVTGPFQVFAMYAAKQSPLASPSVPGSTLWKSHPTVLPLAAALSHADTHDPPGLQPWLGGQVSST
jgi:hypothetical protein